MSDSVQSSGDATAVLAKYELGDVLGEGAFATVRLATRKSDGSRFAMKVIDVRGTDAETVAHERSILTLLGLHRHIVSLVDHFALPEGSAAFVMELADGGEVFDQICERGTFSEADAAATCSASPSPSASSARSGPARRRAPRAPRARGSRRARRRTTSPRSARRRARPSGCARSTRRPRRGARTAACASSPYRRRGTFGPGAEAWAAGFQA